jgi:hypothetical protein
MAAGGSSNAEIAQALMISPRDREAPPQHGLREDGHPLAHRARASPGPDPLRPRARPPGLRATSRRAASRAR